MQGRRSASVLLLAVEIGPKFNCGGASGSAAAHLQSTEYTWITWLTSLKEVTLGTWESPAPPLLLPGLE